MRRTRTSAALAALGLACLAARAADEPLWEAGMGVAAVYLPDYRGSDHSRGRAAVRISSIATSSSPTARACAGLLQGRPPTCTCLRVRRSRGDKNNLVRAGMPDLRPSGGWPGGRRAPVALDSKATVEARFALRRHSSRTPSIGAQFAAREPRRTIRWGPGMESRHARRAGLRGCTLTGILRVSPNSRPRPALVHAAARWRHGPSSRSRSAFPYCGRLRALRRAWSRTSPLVTSALRRGRHRDRLDPGRIEGARPVEFGKGRR